MVPPIEYKETDDVRLLKEQLAEAQRFLGVLLDIADLANSVEDADKFLLASLERICLGMNRPLGLVWKLDQTTGELYCVGTADFLKGGATDFLATSRLYRFRPGVGLPGRVLNERTASWISTLI